jgi:hypothetical protein
MGLHSEKSNFLYGTIIKDSLQFQHVDKKIHYRQEIFIITAVRKSDQTSLHKHCTAQQIISQICYCVILFG